MSLLIASHIEMRSNRDGQGRAFIEGTRVRVQDIVGFAEFQGLTPDQIATALPQLTLGQIHAALSFYFDHREEIQAEMRQDADLSKQLRAVQGSGPLERHLHAARERAHDAISS